jgi:hypothetical protein
MEDIEDKYITLSSLHPKLWIRFVNDTFVIWPHGRDISEIFKDHLNIQFEDIKLTMEIEVGEKIPFLEVCVTKNQYGSLTH